MNNNSINRAKILIFNSLNSLLRSSIASIKSKFINDINKLNSDISILNIHINDIEKIALNNKKLIENLVIPDNSSIESIINSSIAKIVADAPEDLDTLKEVADYIASDKTNAANIVIAIDSLTKNLQSEITRAIAAEQNIESRLLFRNIKINTDTGYLYLIYEAESPDEGDVPYME